jgi:hypothetical protein
MRYLLCGRISTSKQLYLKMYVPKFNICECLSTINTLGFKFQIVPRTERFKNCSAFKWIHSHTVYRVQYSTVLCTEYSTVPYCVPSTVQYRTVYRVQHSTVLCTEYSTVPYCVPSTVRYRTVYRVQHSTVLCTEAGIEVLTLTSLY